MCRKTCYLKKVYIIIILLQKDLRTEQKRGDCRKETNNPATKLQKCTCDISHYDEPPYLGEKCENIIFKNTKLTNLSKAWFIDQTSKEFETTTLRFENVEIIQPQERFLEHLKKLQKFEVIRCQGIDFLENTFWPSSISVIEISNSHLLKFSKTIGGENLRELTITGAHLQSFPTISQASLIEKFNFDSNPNVRITYEDIVGFCKFREIYADQLVGTNKPVSSKKDYCNCVRLWYWLYFFKIATNIKYCEVTGAKILISAKSCNYNYSYESFTTVDSCERKILILDKPPTMPKRPKDPESKLKFIVIAIATVLALIIVTLVYIFFIRKKPVEASTEDQKVNSEDVSVGEEAEQAEQGESAEEQK